MEVRSEPLLPGSRVNAPNCQAAPAYLQFYVETGKEFLQITSNKWRTYTHVHTPWFNYTAVHLNKKCFFKNICLTYSMQHIFFKYLFTYLAVPGLSCSMWNPATQGRNPRPLHWNRGVLANGQTGESLFFFFLILNIFLKIHISKVNCQIGNQEWQMVMITEHCSTYLHFLP